MPTSDQNVKGFSEWLLSMPDAELTEFARRYAAQSEQERETWELPFMDNWVARELPGLPKIPAELPSLSLPALERLAAHLQRSLGLIKERMSELRGKSGPKPTPAGWIAGAIFSELKTRRLTGSEEVPRAVRRGREDVGKVSPRSPPGRASGQISREIGP